MRDFVVGIFCDFFKRRQFIHLFSALEHRNHQFSHAVFFKRGFLPRVLRVENRQRFIRVDFVLFERDKVGFCKAVFVVNPENLFKPRVGDFRLGV